MHDERNLIKDRYNKQEQIVDGFFNRLGSMSNGSMS